MFKVNADTIILSLTEIFKFVSQNNISIVTMIKILNNNYFFHTNYMFNMLVIYQ